jgi:hypothetical protein
MKAKQEELESLKKQQGVLNTIFKATFSVPLSIEVNVNEESSPLTVNDTSQEGNNIYPQQCNESC